jgi:hypothetical protein
MNIDNTGQFLSQLCTVPTHKDLFGREAIFSDLIILLKKYPVTEWLSFLSRMQNILAADKFERTERIQRVICGTMGPTVRKKLEESGFLDQKHNRITKSRLYYERQMSTLQQLAVLHAPEIGTSKIETNKGRDDLSTALLMTMDIMSADRPLSSTIESLLAIAIQDQIRMSTTPAPMYAARALHFYELDQDQQSKEVSDYLELFEKATGVSAVNFILGGLDIIAWEETRSLDEIAKAWHTVPRLNEHENPKEAEILSAYKAVRMKTLSDLRVLIREREKDRPVRDWNLVALSQAPICDLGDMGAFVLNHTALGRSLFDSVRHAILTAALEKRLPKPYTNEKAIGRLYGKIFESYVFSLFKSAYPERVWAIPEDNRKKRSDFLIWFPDKVIVVEAKGTHFIGLDHVSFLSIDKRRKELEKIGIPNAINQLESTISAIRRQDIVSPSMPSYDWTITPIVPVIVTEEQMPLVPGCWDVFYGPFCAKLDGLTAAGPLAKLRLLTIRDVERLPDMQAPHDLATMLIRWGSDPSLMELTWGSFLSKQGVNFQRFFIPGRFCEMMKYFARRLGQ